MGKNPDRKNIWIDCSRAITAGMGVWPGDRPVEIEQRREPGFVLSSLATTCHVGTHVDAPLHIDATGAPVDRIPLARFLGRAEVVAVSAGADLVDDASLPTGWRPAAARVLFKTGSFPLGAEVGPGFAALAPGLAAKLAAGGVEVLGIDTPSVDRFDEASTPVHHELAAAGITWIEGLWLGGAAPGLYEMVGLPMALVGVEAAPMRVALRAMEMGEGS